MEKKSKKCIPVAVSDVMQFRLKYAKPKHYGWSIFGFIGYPYIHGGYSVFTASMHLIVTITVTAAEENAFTYSEKKMSYEKLKMFARFPQGIPPNVDLASIL